MPIVELILPKMGESIMEATILKWHKKVGDHVKLDETVLDIATDKVDSEVQSTAEGIITEILCQEDDVVNIGAVLARIDTQQEGQEVAASPAIEQPATQNSIPLPVTPAFVEKEVPFVPQNTVSTQVSANRFYSPLVLNIAANEGVAMAELEYIPGTGSEGRVTKKDILTYVANRKNNVSQVQQPVAASSPVQQQPVNQVKQDNIRTEPQQKTEHPVISPKPAIEADGNVEIIEMDRMRKLIAKHMVNSVQTSPHVTSFAEADVTNMVLWRNSVKNQFEQRENIKLTFTPLFIECVARAIKKYPLINSSVDSDRIIVKKDINIGMATALPNDNLIVPVIKNADYLNLTGLSRMVSNLAENARNNKLKPEDTQGGTFTLTNIGTFGSIMGTPIISQPQVAILAVGAIKKRPVVIEEDQGDAIAIRHMMYLSLSYDHRIIDGNLGSRFLAEVVKEFENWNMHRQLI